MEAKRCDSCGRYYTLALQSRVTMDVPINLPVLGHEGEMTIRVTIEPFHNDNRGEHQQDLCSGCKRRMIYRAGQAMRKHFGGSRADQKGDSPR